jgi:hypothetical protein
MGRRQVYSDAAERQRACRARHALNNPVTQLKAGRKVSRPARLRVVESAVRALVQEYESWLSSLPASLEGSGQAELLSETIGTLDEIADQLGELRVPRGFGRD